MIGLLKRTWWARPQRGRRARFSFVAARMVLLRGVGATSDAAVSNAHSSVTHFALASGTVIVHWLRDDDYQHRRVLGRYHDDHVHLDFGRRTDADDDWRLQQLPTEPKSAEINQCNHAFLIAGM
jgi:hypothetical protein